MNFTTSTKLVCIDDSPPPEGDFLIGPMIVKNTVYVVREADPPQHSNDPGGVRVVGVSVFKEHGQEIWWRSNRFRRLEDVQNESRVTTTEPCNV